MSAIPPLSAKPGYRPQAEDTSIESDLVQFYLLRQRTPAQRLAMAAKLTRGAKSLSLLGIKRARGEAYPEYFARAVLGEKWMPILTPSSPENMWIQDSIELVRQLHPILEDLAIPCYVTDGVAAIAHGEPRTTRDLDLVIEIDRSDISRLVSVLEQARFYCPPGAVEDIQTGRGRVLSITHMDTVLNADIVINSDTPFDHSKMARRQLRPADETGTFHFWISSPEDLILAKRLWGRQSQSEKQWRDVLGVMKVQGESLDFTYLFHWAEQLGLIEALSRAFTEAGI
jgi:hypothetical protein